jgi:histidyl-tRNA synthetase
MAGLEELGRLAAAKGTSDVLVLAGPGASAQVLAQHLRDQGINTEVYLDDRKVAQQYKYAESKGIRFVVQTDPAQCKDTATGEVRGGTAAEWAAWITASAGRR